VTIGFDFSGPHKLHAFCRAHEMAVALPPDRMEADLFLIDCEGMNDLEGSSPGHGRVMMALSQIATVTVLVHGRLLSSDDIPRVARFLQMAKLISASSGAGKLETGFVTIERGIGIPVEADVPDDSAEYEQIRHGQDKDRRKTLLRWLRQSGVQCSDDNFRALIPPEFDEPNGYWASMRDLLSFIETITSRTLIVPGRVLHEVFSRALNLTDVAITGESFDRIFSETVRQLFHKAKDDIKQFYALAIQHPITSLCSEALLNFRQRRFVHDQVRWGVDLLRKNCNTAYPDSIHVFHELYAPFEELVKREISNEIRTVYAEQCFLLLFPDVIHRIVAGTEEQATKTLSNMTPVEFEQFSGAQFCSDIEAEAERKLYSVASWCDPEFLSDPRFHKLSRHLRETVNAIANEYEREQRLEHHRWRRETERQRREEEAAELARERERVLQERAARQEEWEIRLEMERREIKRQSAAQRARLQAELGEARNWSPYDNGARPVRRGNRRGGLALKSRRRR
jgi:hypothetical protein